MDAKMFASILVCALLICDAAAEEPTKAAVGAGDGQDLKTAESSRFLNWYGGNGGYRPGTSFYPNNGYYGNGYYGNGYNYPNPNYNPTYYPNAGYPNFNYPNFNNGFGGYPGGYPGGYQTGFGNGYSTGFGSGFNSYTTRYRGNEYTQPTGKGGYIYK